MTTEVSSAAFPRRSGLHLAVEIIGNLKRGLHKISLLYCAVSIKGQMASSASDDM